MAAASAVGEVALLAEAAALLEAVTAFCTDAQRSEFDAATAEVARGYRGRDRGILKASLTFV
jgi:hypothetical protein